jgi:uncharacterized membrane protein
MQAKVRLFGHPIHQMLIVFPLGLLATSLFFDIARLSSGNPQWGVISYWLIVVGIVTGLLAAVFGLIDWLSIPTGTRARRIGRLHGLGNVVVVGLFAASWFLRRDDPGNPAGAAVTLSVLAVLLALVTGWLGGELVDRLGIGVDEGANLNAPSSLSAHSAGDPGRATAVRAASSGQP